MNSYEHLFSPIQIGTTTVKNRVFMPPISTNLADKGYVTDELVEHYAARAKGGVGLIITEVTTVEPTYIYLPGDMSICDDSYIPGWKKLTDAVHKYGAKILPQLFHPAYMAFPIPGTPQLIAPSNVGPYYAKEAPRAVTIEELKVIIRQFGEAAFRVKQAGGDGVEIHAAHAHGLLGGFLSPLYNKRTDAYGGDIHGRLRLTLEVIEEVRKMCGKDFIIDVRISGDEYTDGGQNLNDAVYVAKQLEKAGLISSMYPENYNYARKFDPCTGNTDGIPQQSRRRNQKTSIDSGCDRRAHHRAMVRRRIDCKWKSRYFA